MADELQPQSAPAPITRGSRKTRTGEVVSSGMNKTIVVRTVTRVPHPKFGKIVKQTKKILADGEQNRAETCSRGRTMGDPPVRKVKPKRPVEGHQKEIMTLRWKIGPKWRW